MPGNFRGCSRGIFALRSWEPLRKPGEPMANGRAPKAAGEPRPGHQQQNAQQQPPAKPSGGKEDPRAGRKMKSKYTYKANPDSPMGAELSFKQLEDFTFVSECPENEHWWMARNAQGVEGYVPRKYMQMEEAKPSSLPWLQNKELLEKKDKKDEPQEPPEKLEYKGYKSAYDKSGQLKKEAAAVEETEEYRCDICDKNLNGPHPYRSHMNSKAHREMVEYMEGN